MMPPGIQTPPFVFSFHLGILVQDLHHRSLLLLVLDQHAASTAHVFDNIDDFAEAGGCAAPTSASPASRRRAAPVFEDDEELDDEGYGLDLQI
jgi:hypothetical protein